MEKDYFQAQFLLALPSPGYYSVQVHAHLLDRDGRVWHLGQSSVSKVSVMVDSEENFKLQQKQRDSAAAQSSSQTGGGGGGGGKAGGHK